jgi:DNA processing protein
MPPDELCAWIALNLLPGLGPVLVQRALRRWSDPAEIAYRVPHEALATLPGFRADRDELAAARHALPRLARAELARCNKLGVRLLVHGDAGYPALLEEISDPPVLLYAWGELTQGVTRVAVVGSRRPTSYGTGRARALAAELAGRGVEIVSGGARGVDSLAHTETLAVGGRTTVVLGSGLARPYPKENRSLFEEIGRHGAVLSEFPLDHGPKPGNFPRRNRVISGLSAAVLVVEANERSGSLITARHALEQGREVLAVPGPVTSERSVGCHRLIQQGAKLVQEAQDIIDELSPLYAKAVGPKLTAGQIGDPNAAQGVLDVGTDDEMALHQILDRAEAIHLDDLAERAPFGLARLQLALLGLQLQGAVEALPGHYYRRRDR